MLARIVPVLAGLLVVAGLGLPGSALASKGCPNEQLRAESNSLGLLDCRAYEMVTPADKNSAVVKPIRLATVAADGSSLAGSSEEGFAGIDNGEATEHRTGIYRFSRTGSGWVTAPLSPYRGELLSIGTGALDSVWGPVEPDSMARLQLRAANGSLSEIGPVWPPSLGPIASYQSFVVVGGAADAADGVVFKIRTQGFLWPFDSIRDGDSLYEYTGTGNVAPSLIGVSGGSGSTALVSECGALLGDEEEGARNAVSESGGTVFFTALGADDDDCGGVQPSVNELFARIDEDSTVAISEPSASDCPSCDTGTPEDASFRGASADGSKVFFTTTQTLLGRDTSENLYEYDFNPPTGGPKVVRVSAGEGVSEPTAEVLGVSEVSEDGSHVYFTARGVLTNVANDLGERAQMGEENFYVWERDAEYPAGHTAFIAACGDTGDGQVTPDGRFLLFTTACHLTADDTGSARQVFQYDAQTGSMVRVSASLAAYDHGGNVGEDPYGEFDANIVTQEVAVGEAIRGGALARSMSDDGSYVFFQSPLGLTPGALNEIRVLETNAGIGYAQNVYELHDGRLSLIGSDSSPPELHNGTPVLIGVSASGGDVFFRTGDQLIPQDADTQIDFYDARVDGGFPAPVVPTRCVGETCQGSPSAPPVFSAPSSAVFSGDGNLTSAGSVPAVTPKRALTRSQKSHRR